MHCARLWSLFLQRERCAGQSHTTIDSYCFSQGCWNSYVSLEVSEARVSQLHCPSAQCAQPLGDVTALVVLAAHKPAARLLRFSAAKQVLDDRRTRVCPRRGCGRVLRSTAASVKQLAPGAYMVCDHCLAQTCLRCQMSAHWPASCDVRAWGQMMFARAEAASSREVDEMKSLQWIVGHTKDCPKCGVAIEKNMGCNHMHCRECNYDFCWYLVVRHRRLFSLTSTLQGLLAVFHWKPLQLQRKACVVAPVGAPIFHIAAVCICAAHVARTAIGGGAQRDVFTVANAARHARCRRSSSASIRSYSSLEF